MKIYISGKITDNPYYLDDFKMAEERLTKLGHTVINPSKKNEGFTYREYIDLGLNELMHCDAIYMLNGWMGSKGARLEFNYAQTVGMDIICEGEVIPNESYSMRQNFETS